MCFIHYPSDVENYSIGHKSETDRPKQKQKNRVLENIFLHLHTGFGLKNSPIKGWGGLSKMSNKMSKMSIIELSRLGQDLFDFSGLTWAHPLTHPSTHR